MITKQNLNPLKVATCVWHDVLLALVVATGVYIAHQAFDVREVALSFAPPALLGTALSIFLAFRANTAFARWGEASQTWAGIINSSRVFVRLVITFTDAHRQSAQYDKGRAEGFKLTMAYRRLAWVHALRLQLRGHDRWDDLKPYLSEAEYAAVNAKHNKLSYLLRLQGDAIYHAMADGTLQGFDSFQLEGQLAALSGHQATCERIKTIPVPRQYDYFTRLFVRIFSSVAPFFVLATFAAAGVGWLVIPFSALLAFVFTTIERTGAVNEQPFENRITDVPLAAFCRVIERDVQELLGGTELPPPLLPQRGYLY